MFQYFTVSCYKGFGDDPAGFYAVYSEIFDKIATEDIEFMDSPEEFESIPKFGTATSIYDDVVGPFYAYWQSYCTRKTYAWLCPHNVSEYRDRRILREIEKETKKIAQKAKRERNDEIRALVAFVRKRDKRVLEYKRVLEEKAEQNRIKQQMHRLQQLKRNQEEAEAMRKNTKSLFNTTDHEEQLRQLEQAYGTDSDYEDESGEEEEEEEGDGVDGEADEGDQECDTNGVGDSDAEELLYVDDLYCVACNKAFKNELSYENHESSKKHRENTERLKRKLQAEDKLYEKSKEANGQTDDNDIDDELLDDIEKSDEETVAATSASKQKLSKKAKRAKNKKQQIHVDRDGETEEEEEPEEIIEIEQPLADVSLGNTSDVDESWAEGNKKLRKGKNRKGQPKAGPSKPDQNRPAASDQPEVHDQNGIAEEASKKSSKNKNKKIEKPEKVGRVAPDNEPDLDVSHTCVTCKSSFDSKNKLYNHLKKTNHGVYLPKASAAATAPTETTKKGRRK